MTHYINEEEEDEEKTEGEEKDKEEKKVEGVPFIQVRLCEEGDEEE